MEYEIHRFRQSKQFKSESIDAFHVRLRSLAVNCEFADIEREIKSQIIQNCYSHKLRLKSLQDSPTLEQLLIAARSMEMAESQAKLMEKSTESEEVCTLKKSKDKQSKLKCYRCGKAYPHVNTPCPAMGKTCNYCGKENHFSSMCKLKANKNRSNTTNVIDESEENSGNEIENDDSDHECI